LAGQVVRVCTTGGGGWGDPLARETELVLRDVVDGKVSAAAAREDYGVVVREFGGELTIDEPATVALRDKMRAARTGALPMIDRGPGYERLRASGA
jgi:N-methylhydantoinase B